MNYLFPRRQTGKMLSPRRRSCICLLLFFLLSAPFSAKALDPSTICAALPEASALAQQWSPHAFSGITSFAAGLAAMGKDTVDILRLPLGTLQCTLGGPFGMFDTGLHNLAVGGLAPLKLAWHAGMLPVRLLSLGTIR